MFRNALKLGVKISFGTDAAVFPHGQNAKEFKLMVDLGMTPVDALRSATANDAELLGIGQRSARWKKANWPMSLLPCRATRLPTLLQPSAFCS